MEEIECDAGRRARVRLIRATVRYRKGEFMRDLVEEECQSVVEDINPKFMPRFGF
jgi:hypothetical protein